MKKIFYDLLSLGPLSFERFQERDYNIDPKKAPSELLQELANQKKAKNMINTLNLRGQSGARVLRRYTIVHWCLVYQPSLCEAFLSALLDGDSSDEWLTINILKPYGAFLMKLCSSEQDYKRSKGYGVLQISFKLLFYVSTLLQELFLAAKKISPLARYYKENLIQSQSLLKDFVMMLAYHAQELYTTFKAILGQIIRFPEKYVKTVEEREMVKFLLQDQLININQSMKALFLDKYFFPFGLGYGVKLLKIQELADDSKDFVDDLLFNLPIKVKKPKRQTLDRILFDQKGKLNPEIITTLTQIRLGDETMRNSFVEESFRSHRQPRRSLAQNIEDI